MRLLEQLSPRAVLGRFSGPAEEFATLAATAAGLAVWLILDCIDVQIAISYESLRGAVADPRWQPHLPLLKIAAAVVGLSLVVMRHLHARVAPAQTGPNCGAAARLAWVLIALRLLSLWDPITNLLPYLSMLWAPHAGWALLAACSLAPHAPAMSSRMKAGFRIPDFAVGAVVTLCCAVLYAIYGIYIGQMSMLHGDEAHYLRVTQSLLKDGDFDLANNLDDRHVAEFHTLQFDVHKAASSPPGKVHSVHPIGLSVLLMPAYWLGLELWANPRLACILFMNLMTAACCGLAYCWLVRIEVARVIALMAVGVMATTVPLALYSTQLFPDVPALLITLLALLALSAWQVRDARYVALRWEPFFLAIIALLLAGLVFLHPRYAPLSLALGLPLLLQARAGKRPSLNIAAVAAAAIVALVVILRYHYAYSGDWMGPFRPGNAWGGDALQPSTWWVSLPGHWLHDRKGLLNNAPVFALFAVGFGLLLAHRDRRVVTVLMLYAATALVNGIHPTWTFGFCLPARFLITALPALLLCLATGLATACRSAVAIFFTALAVAVGWDTVRASLDVPEFAYHGIHLSVRAIEDFYPFSIHFFEQEVGGPPLFFLAFWFVPSFCLVAYHIAPRWRGLRLAAVAVAALTPAVWGVTETVGSRISEEASPYLAVIEDESGEDRSSLRSRTLEVNFHESRTGIRDGDSHSANPAQHEPGLLAAYRLPIRGPGLYRLTVPRVTSGGAVDKHSALIAYRQTLPAAQKWETRFIRPLGGQPGSSSFTTDFHIDHLAFGHVYFMYSGRGGLELAPLTFHFSPVLLDLVTEKVHSLDTKGMQVTAGGLFVSTDLLPRGRYNLNFALRGSTLSTLFERRAAPLFIALDWGPGERWPEMKEEAAQWFQQERSLATVLRHPEFSMPKMEAVFPPWWLALPFGQAAYSLSFSLPQESKMLVAVKYTGPEEIFLDEIKIEQMKLGHQLRYAK